MTAHFLVKAKYGMHVSHRPYFVTDLALARRAAIEDGAQVIFKISPVKQNMFTRQFLSRDYAILLLRTISFQVESGISPAKATLTAIESEQDPSKRAQLQPAVDALSRGATLAEAMQTTGLYDNTAYSMMAAGERIGGGAAIAAALEYLEDKKTSWKAYKIAIGMLFMEGSTALTLPPTIDSFAIPWIRENLPKTSPSDLAVFQSQLDTIEFNNMVWMWVSFGAIGIISGMVAAWFFNMHARSWLTDNVLVKIPLVGAWYTHDALSRSANIFATMLNAGVRITDAIHSIVKTTSNGVALRFWRKTSDALQAGAIPATAFASAGILRHDELLVLNAARGNAQIAKVFSEISKDHAWRKQKMSQQIFKMSIAITVIYIVITLAIGFRLFNLFNAGMEMTMNSMTKGL